MWRMFHVESAGAGAEYPRPPVKVTGPHLPNHCLARHFSCLTPTLLELTTYLISGDES